MGTPIPTLESPSRIEDHDIIAVRIGRPEAIDRTSLNQSFRHDAIEQCAGVVEQFARGLAVMWMLQDRGEAALELPRGEEERPVDVGNDLGEIDVEHPCPGERRHGDG